MRLQHAKTITVGAMIGLLLSSFMVFVGGMSHAEAQETSTSEVSAASGSNRFVVWSDDTPGLHDIFFRRSTDNGATWKPVVNVANTVFSSMNPQIAVVGSNVYVVWQETRYNADPEFERILFVRSADNGATWSSPVRLDTSNRADPPKIAGSGSNVYVVWSGGSDTSENEILFRRSTDNGATWKPIQNLSNNPGQSGIPSLAVSGTNVYVVWSQYNVDHTMSDAFFRRSSDNGATWKPFKNLSSNGASGSPQIAVSGPNVHAVWVDKTVGNGDLVTRRSTNGGVTWTSIKNLSDSPTEMFNLAQIVLSGTNVYVVWSDGTSLPSGNSDIFFRMSTDRGATWKSKIQLVTNPGQSYPPLIAVSGSNVYVSWLQANVDRTLFDVFFRRSADSGATWKAVKNLSSNGRSFQPDLNISGSNVYVVWQESRAGNFDRIILLHSIDSAVTWKSPKVISGDTGEACCPQIAV